MLPIHAEFLSKINKLKPTKHNEWIGCCTVHDDKHPSMSIKITDDNDLLLHCFSCGASYVELVQAAGIDPFDLIPEHKRYTTEQYKKIKSYISGDSMLRILENEVLTISLIASDMVNGVVIGKDDFNKLLKSYEKIQECSDYIKKLR